jgi:hypothetical protein
MYCCEDAVMGDDADWIVVAGQNFIIDCDGQMVHTHCLVLVACCD